METRKSLSPFTSETQSSEVASFGYAHSDSCRQNSLEGVFADISVALATNKCSVHVCVISLTCSCINLSWLSREG